MAARSAQLMGAGRVIVVDRIPERLAMAREEFGADIVDYSATDSVTDEIREMTGGRGPDAVIEAVGMEGHGTGVGQVYDKAKQALRLERKERKCEQVEAALADAQRVAQPLVDAFLAGTRVLDAKAIAQRRAYIIPRMGGNPLVMVRRVTVTAEYVIRSQTRVAMIDPA